MSIDSDDENSIVCAFVYNTIGVDHHRLANGHMIDHNGISGICLYLPAYFIVEISSTFCQIIQNYDKIMPELCQNV